MSEEGRRDLNRRVLNAVEYVARKFDMDYGEMVGILESIKLDIHKLSRNEEEEVEGGDE